MSFRKHAGWHTRSLRSEESTLFTPWLRDRGSLTGRLQAMGMFSVRLLRQGLAVPTLDEAAELGIKNKRVAWVREVALLCDSHPMVFAHSVLPYRPRGPMCRWFARMGTRSLGALLFAHAGFKRGKLKSRRLDHRHPLFAPALAAILHPNSPRKHLWARRSIFSFGTQSVLVTEVFSPEICRDQNPERSTEK